MPSGWCLAVHNHYHVNVLYTALPTGHQSFEVMVSVLSSTFTSRVHELIFDFYLGLPRVHDFDMVLTQTAISLINTQLYICTTIHFKIIPKDVEVRDILKFYTRVSAIKHYVILC